MATLSSINASTFKFTHGAHSEVEVGDIASSGFKPHAKIKKWGDECHLSILFPSALKRTPTISNGVITWSTPAADVRFYTFDPDAEHEDGKFEYEVILKNKPPTNKIVLDINTHDLDFFYQPPLEQWEIDKGNTRPDNVVGSYAVYHSTRGNVHKGQADADKYKTGKAFHIYRPELIDALGNRIWADLSIDVVLGKMTITASQAWLDSAAYPVIVDPTFGYTGGGASTETTNAFHNSTKVVPSESGTISSYTAYIKFITADDTLYLGLYSDDGADPSHPNARLEYGTVAVTANASFTWNTVSSMSYAFTGATTYWLGQGPGNGGVTGYREAYDAGSANGSWYKSGNALPDPFGTAATSGLQTKKYSSYATYVAAGGSNTGVATKVHHYKQLGVM